MYMPIFPSGTNLRRTKVSMKFYSTENSEQLLLILRCLWHFDSNVSKVTPVGREGKIGEWVIIFLWTSLCCNGFCGIADFCT